jgi:hypothetical protein
LKSLIEILKITSVMSYPMKVLPMKVPLALLVVVVLLALTLVGQSPALGLLTLVGLLH